MWREPDGDVESDRTLFELALASDLDSESDSRHQVKSSIGFHTATKLSLQPTRMHHTTGTPKVMIMERKLEVINRRSVPQWVVLER